MENWVDIQEFNCHYQISNYGNVRRKSRTTKSSIQPCGFRIVKERMCAQQDNGKGYKQIYVSINKKRTMLYVHRLVAKYFVFNNDVLNKFEVNHIDTQKNNNHFNNLEWVTRRENMNHAVKCNLMRKEGGRSPMLSNLIVNEIRQYYKNNPLIKKTEISKKYNISLSSTYRVLTGKDTISYSY